MVEDIKIRYDGLYITVELPNGILVTWDGIISTQVSLYKIFPCVILKTQICLCFSSVNTVNTTFQDIPLCFTNSFPRLF